MTQTYVLADLLPSVLSIAQKAGEKILAVAQQAQALSITAKADNSPVTEADMAAHTFIEEALQALTPDLPQLSEESSIIDFTTRQNWQTYWLIDPLDGTKEFIAGTQEYTVNIALIHDQQPILGVIHVPASGQSYTALKNAGSYFCASPGAKLIPIHARAWLSTRPTIAISRRHQSQNPALLALLETLSDFEKCFAGSSLKFCLLAEGKADLYPRFGPTSEWDTAAGQVILEEAGGAILDLAGHPLRYNTKDALLNPSFLAVADAQYDWQPVLMKIRQALDLA